MRAGSRQLDLITDNAIDQEPVGLDVEVAIPPPIAFERVVAIVARQGFSLDQEGEDRPKPLDIFAASCRLLKVTPESDRSNDNEHVRDRRP